jgi:hypothetical protein
VFYSTNNLPFDLKRFTCVGLSTVYHHYDLAIWGAILAVKFKAIIIGLAVLFGAGVYYKLFPGYGYYKGFKCAPPMYDSQHRYNYEYGPGPAAYGHSERSDRASDLTESSEKLDFELLATVMRGYVK